MLKNFHARSKGPDQKEHFMPEEGICGQDSLVTVGGINQGGEYGKRTAAPTNLEVELWNYHMVQSATSRSVSEKKAGYRGNTYIPMFVAVVFMIVKM